MAPVAITTCADGSMQSALCARSLAALVAASNSQPSISASPVEGDKYAEFTKCRGSSVTTANMSRHEVIVSTPKSDYSDSLSTHTGDDTLSLPPSSDDRSGDASLCCSSSHICFDSSDGETSDFEQYDIDPALFVYPIAMLLRLGAAASAHKRHFAAAVGSVLVPTPLACCYSTRFTSELSGSTAVASRVASAKKPRKGLPAPSTKSFAAQQRARKCVGDTDHCTKVSRTACSILNKLTVEKFDSLYEQLATCGIQTSGDVVLVMREIFEMATGQHHFIPMYADLCARLELDPRVAPEMKASSDSFRHQLLNQCQKAFEQLLQPPCDEESWNDDESRLRRKQQALGNIKFVGQLIVRKMLPSRLLVACAEELLRRHETCTEALESLAALITSAGKTFDTADWTHVARLDAVFARILELTKAKSVAARVRFLLRDVLDLRQAGWPDTKPCAAGKPAAPMRLEDVRNAVQTQDRKPLNVPVRVRTTPDNGSSKKQSVDSLKNVLEVCSRPIPSHAVQAPGPAPWRRGKNGPRSSADQDGIQKFSPVSVHEVVSKDCPRSERMTPPAPQVSVAPAPADSQDRALPGPGAPAPPAAASSPPTGEESPFNSVTFHRELSTIMRELCSDRNVPAAVRRVREQKVPVGKQAAEFADILTRAADESRGPARRSTFAFAAGLAAAQGEPAFERKECLAGILVFFQEVYPDLCSEVPRLPNIVAAELIPTLRSVLPGADLNAVLPQQLRTV